MKRKLKTVTQRLEKADKLLAAMKAVAEAVCDCLAGSLCVALTGGETAPDLRVLLALLERRVTALARRLKVCQEILSDWQQCERYSAEARDTAAASVRQKLILLRSLATHAFGEPGTELMGLAGGTPREHKRLLEAAKTVAARLRDPDLALPVVATPCLEINFGYVTEELETDLIHLEESLDERARAGAQAQTAQTARWRAEHELDRVVAATSDLVASLCTLAGRCELADQIRRAAK